jgi:ATP-binding cassette subfamily F protein uup
MSLLISLSHAKLVVANQELLSDVSWQIHEGQRFALIGRNGAGKSSLLQVLQGKITLDSGRLSLKKGLKIAGLAQDFQYNEDVLVFHALLTEVQRQGVDLPFEAFDLVNGYLSLDAIYHDQTWLLNFVQQFNTLCQTLKVSLDRSWMSLSGGMKRRVTLVAAILVKPDVLLLDEPTNHMDIEAIMWLQNFLLNFKGAVVFVTHDRYFLKAVSNCIVALNSGQLKQYDLGYEAYLNQREAELAAIEHENQRLRHHLAAEEHWLQRGVTARRTRNQGRLNALFKLRQTVAERRKQFGAPGHWNPEMIKSGRVILTAEHLCFSFQDKKIVDDFSFMLMRGDKIGIVGPNGCGKTSLARLLLGDIAPQSGTIKHRCDLSVLYFDQMQAGLDLNKTLLENIAEGTEYIEGPQGKQHVSGYLKQFLFYPDQFLRPVYTLSGGERQRLLLAKCLLKSSHFMVLDEPSNDLDLETLEHLSSMLVNYSGSFILISHDRALIEDVVTRLIVWEAPGVFREILPEQWNPNLITEPLTSKIKPNKVELKQDKTLSYAEQKELLKLPDEISKLEAKISNLHLQIAEPDFYQQEESIRSKILIQLAELEEKLSGYYSRWEYLEAQ